MFEKNNYSKIISKKKKRMKKLNIKYSKYKKKVIE